MKRIFIENDTKKAEISYRNYKTIEHIVKWVKEPLTESTKVIGFVNAKEDLK